MRFIEQMRKSIYCAALFFSFAFGYVEPNDPAVDISFNLPGHLSLAEPGNILGANLPTLIINGLKVGADITFAVTPPTAASKATYQAQYINILRWIFRDLNVGWSPDPIILAGGPATAANRWGSNSQIRYTTQMNFLVNLKLKSKNSFKQDNRAPHTIVLQGYTKIRQVIDSTFNLATNPAPVTLAALAGLTPAQLDSIKKLALGWLDEFVNLHPLNNDTISALHYLICMCLSVARGKDQNSYNQLRSAIITELQKVR